jgi:hypothetical protein
MAATIITVEEMRSRLRITHTDLDTEIGADISSCLDELTRVGVSATPTEDTVNLINKAAELYCKWQFDFQGRGEQYQKHYVELKDALSLTEKYREDEVD